MSAGWNWRYDLVKVRLSCECLKVADCRSPGSTFQRLLWGKLTLKSNFSAAKNDPKRKLKTKCGLRKSTMLYWPKLQSGGANGRSQELQDRSRRVLTTCGGAPSYRGALAANVLTRMGFTDASFVDGGMAALLAAGIETK